jgi:hypothetical protein
MRRASENLIDIEPGNPIAHDELKPPHHLHDRPRLEPLYLGELMRRRPSTAAPDPDDFQTTDTPF